jgi:hypothetical protein
MFNIEWQKKMLRKSTSIHLFLSLIITILSATCYLHLSLIESVGFFILTSIIVSIVSPIKYRIHSKWKSFFNVIQLKEQDYNEQDKQIEYLSKKILFQLYCNKHLLKAKEYGFYNKGYSKDELSLQNLSSKLNLILQTYPQGREKVYQKVYQQFFQKDALVSYAMTHQEKHFIQFLINNDLLKFFNEDLTYLNYGNNVHKSIATLLFKKEVYKTLPQEVRSYLLTHISKKSKESFEKEALLLEKTIQQNEKNKEHNLEVSKNDIFFPIFAKYEVIYPHITKQLQDSLSNIYEILHFLHDNCSYLIVEQQIEFNNIYQKMLPTYLNLFIQKEFNNIIEFQEGIALIEESLVNYRQEILNVHSDKFEAYHHYIINKLDKNMTMSS